MKKVVLILLLIVISFAGCTVHSDNGNEPAIRNESSTSAMEPVLISEPDYDVLKIKQYDYSSEFVMGANLQMAIEALGEFDESQINEEWWIDNFVNTYIQNSRRTFDYLNQLIEQNKGYVNSEELAYIHYSLTGKMLDFSMYNSGKPVNAMDSSSFLTHKTMDSYTVELDGDTVILKVVILTLRDGDEPYAQVWDYRVELEKNPYSCFDGYSIKSITVG